MGREIRRVPAGFDWPVGKKWDGFINPHSPRDCPACENGYSVAAKRYQDEWYGYAPFDPHSTGSKPFGPEHPAVVEFATRNVDRSPAFYIGHVTHTPTARERAIRHEAIRLSELWDRMWMHHLAQIDVDALIEAGRLHDLTHTYTREGGWVPKDPPVRPTAEQVNVWSLHGFGHDGINSWICVKARCERNGEPNSCPNCEGTGQDPTDADTIKASEEWEPTPPPAGDWWQLWETTSEGSPKTPAFATAEELARYCVANQFNGKTLSDGEPWNALAGGTARLTFDQWIAFIVGRGWAPSMVAGGGRVMSGVEAVTA